MKVGVPQKPKDLTSMKCIEQGYRVGNQSGQRQTQLQYKEYINTTEKQGGIRKGPLYWTSSHSPLSEMINLTRDIKGKKGLRLET